MSKRMKFLSALLGTGGEFVERKGVEFVERKGVHEPPDPAPKPTIPPPKPSDAARSVRPPLSRREGI